MASRSSPQPIIEADDRIVEPAERRIGLDTADRHIHTLHALQRRLATGRALAVVTAIGHAARRWGNNGSAGVQGKLRRGEHIPDDERPANVGVQAVALVVRQMQLLAGESPGLFGIEQARTQFRAAGRIGNHLVHRLARAQQLPLALANWP